MRVLVTGASSMLGAAVAQRLIDRGDAVRALQRNPAGLAGEEHLGSVADPSAVLIAMSGCDAVVHLAARVAVTGPLSEFRKVNVEGTRNVVHAAGAAGVSRMVHVSTPSVAHTGEALVGAPAGPADPDNARGHYARTKAEAEILALDAIEHGLNVVAIRPHLVWGPGDTQLIDRIVTRSQQGRLALIGSGGALIDTTWVGNAADAIVCALDRSPDLAGQAFVVSNGEPRTVKELLDRITHAAGVAPHGLAVPRRVAHIGGGLIERLWDRQERTDDPPMTSFLAEQLSTAHWFDQRDTRAALGWEPTVSLDEGFTQLKAWFDAQQA